MNKTIIIAAVASNGVMGNTQTNDLPWPRIMGDMTYFKDETTRILDTIVMMGGKTYLSIPDMHRPLPDRQNVVISRTMREEDFTGIRIVKSIDDAMLFAKLYAPAESNIFVAGGGTIYQQTMEQNRADELWITHILQAFEGDVFFPSIDENIWECYHKFDTKETKSGLQYYFARYKKKQ